MRVLHVTKKYADAIGGDARVVAELRAQQRGAGHEVMVLTTRCPEIVDGPDVVKFGLPDRTEELDRVGPRRLLSLVSLAFTAGRLLRRWRPDVVHSHSPDLGFVVTVLARTARIPVVHTCHGTGVGSQWVSAWKRRLESALLRGAGFARITVLSLSDAEALRRNGIQRIEVIPNGVSLPEPATGTPPGRAQDAPLRFLAVGRLEPQKAFDLLITAAGQANRERPGRVRVKVVGDGSQREPLAELVRSLDLGQVVELPGPVPPPGMPGEYAVADAFVLSSRWEGLPMTLLESWAHGVPAVVTAVGAVPDVVRDGDDALLVPSGDGDALRDAMVRLVDDPALRERLGRRGRDRAARDFSWASVAARYDSLYATLVKR